MWISRGSSRDSHGNHPAIHSKVRRALPCLPLPTLELVSTTPRKGLHNQWLLAPARPRKNDSAAWNLCSLSSEARVPRSSRLMKMTVFLAMQTVSKLSISFYKATQRGATFGKQSFSYWLPWELETWYSNSYFLKMFVLKNNMTYAVQTAITVLLIYRV